MEVEDGATFRLTALRAREPVGSAAPQVLPLPELVAERKDETQRLLGALDAPPAAMPRHLRRRGRSYWPFRLPRHRQGALPVAGNKKRKVRRRCIPASTPGGGGPGAIVGPNGDLLVRVRKHVRRPALLTAARAWATPAEDEPERPRWLETHVWHAKRAPMETIWGYRLAARNAALGVRALQRALSRHCCVHDRSYLQLFEIEGTEADIASTLQRCGVPRELLLSPGVRAGTRRGRALLSSPLKPGEAESSILGSVLTPILFVWQPVSAGVNKISPASGRRAGAAAAQASAAAASQRKLWLWTHPSATRSAVLEALQSAALATSIGAAASAQEPRPRQLEGTVFFELFGPRSLEVLARALPPEACSGAGAALWREVALYAGGRRLTLPAGALLALDVDPEQVAACATPKLPQAEESVLESAHPWLSRWPEAAQATAGGRLWQSVAAASVDSAVDTRPGFDTDATMKSGSSSSKLIPVMIAFRNDSAGVLGGIDVVIPPRSEALHLWLRCHFASARFLGFRDRHALHTGSGHAEFPFDFPESNAGQVEGDVAGARSLERHNRRPPAKRPNYGVLAVPCPHVINWRFVAAASNTVFSRPWILRTAILGARAAALQKGTVDAAGNTRSDAFIAVLVRCPGRGVPKTLSHLYQPENGDFPFLAPSRALGKKCVERELRYQEPQAGSTTRPLQRVVRDCAEPPVFSELSGTEVRLEEPLHVRLKQQRVRREELRRKQQSVDTKECEPRSGGNRHQKDACRPLVGFITSGGQSYKFGCGFGVGAVSTKAFQQVLREQPMASVAGTGSGHGVKPMDVDDHISSQSLDGRWVLLWARNTTSRVYFPVWVKALRRDECLG
eukprot:TRINITY_DN64883_c0_g1_i1.p1 TRINITY_DN64883_c0_g1~~TRINITY_DN64883_c0_g1_i1.p1  ORF type:complete len:851 (+),score=110.85 TRINITY_DN64883_c0_g1_i1:108-2660(+)